MKYQVLPAPGKGRGVFATEDIPSGARILTCSVVIVPRTQTAAVRGTVLGAYVFDWPRGRCAVALGDGSLINHARFPNAWWDVCEQTRTISFYANGPIRAGEEITHDYGWETAKTRRWDKRDAQTKSQEARVQHAQVPETQRPCLGGFRRGRR